MSLARDQAQRTLRLFSQSSLPLGRRNLQTSASLRSSSGSSNPPPPGSPAPRPGKPTSSAPNPLGFLALAGVAFVAFAFVTKKRDQDPEKDKREKRIPHPNPLIPPRQETVS